MNSHQRQPQRRPTTTIVSMLTLALACIPPAAFAEKASIEASYEFSGTATGIGSDGPDALYTEFHQVTGTCVNNVFQPQNRSVSYRRANEAQSELASKRMSYAQSPQRPSYTFEQPNVGEKISVQNQDDKRLMIKADMGENDKKAFEMTLNDQVVVDAGFLSLIRQHWQTLQSGDEVAFEFLSPTRGKTYDFIAEPVAESRLDVALAIKIRPAGMFLNWIVDPVLLGFDAQGRLTDYIGLSNIRKTSDSNYVVHLKYQSATLPCALISPNRS